MVSRELTKAPPERKDMKYKSLGLTVLLAAFAGSALSQTQVSGTSKCGKPDASQPTEVGDHTDHVLVTEKGSCTWNVPLEMAGLKTTTMTLAEAVDANGAKFQVRGYAVMQMDNGDKAYVRYQGTGAATTPEANTGEGTWSYTGGTGKLKGLKGKGTYKTSGSSDGGIESKIEGEYTLPQAGTGK
jgi:hypothetical protein